MQVDTVCPVLGTPVAHGIHQDGSECWGEGRIVQIIPVVPGSVAVYRRAEEGMKLGCPLVAWALVKYCDGRREVVGLDTWADGVVRLCTQHAEFLRYSIPTGPGPSGEPP